MNTAEKNSEEKGPKNYFLGLHPGEVVEVRSEKEIISTLDKDGLFEGLPFLFEMRKYCGQTFHVLRRVNKLIIEGTGLGMRHIKNTVILDGVTCSGEYHGGCNRTCTVLWKEQWLKRVREDSKEMKISEKRTAKNNSKEKGAMSAGEFKCQSTSLIRATSDLPKWDFRQYLWDITSGTYKLQERLWQLLTLFFLKFYSFVSGKSYAAIHGRCKKTPSASLDLQPGDSVEVKSKEEIFATLDSTGKNRGLVFTKEMLKYCGKKFRVLKRLDRMISENTGKMQNIANTVILNGVTCDGKAHGGCQRNCLCFWREIWLKKL